MRRERKGGGEEAAPGGKSPLNTCPTPPDFYSLSKLSLLQTDQSTRSRSHAAARVHVKLTVIITRVQDRFMDWSSLIILMCFNGSRGFHSHRHKVLETTVVEITVNITFLFPTTLTDTELTPPPPPNSPEDVV